MLFGIKKKIQFYVGFSVYDLYKLACNVTEHLRFVTRIF